MISGWRRAFAQPSLWFGFVQIAGYRYSHPWGNPPRAEVDHSHMAGDLRQAQLAALTLPNVGMSSAIDTGDWTNIQCATRHRTQTLPRPHSCSQHVKHMGWLVEVTRGNACPFGRARSPPDKQTVSRRLANQALAHLYSRDDLLPTVGFPMYSSSRLLSAAPTVEVVVYVRSHGRPIALTTAPPPAATRSSTLGAGPELPRNKCVTSVAAFGLTFPQDCGYPQIIGEVNFTNGSAPQLVYLNATATIVGNDSSAIRMSAQLPAELRGGAGGGATFVPTATSYGRASWPMTVFWSRDGRLPLLPWLKGGLDDKAGPAESKAKGELPPGRHYVEGAWKLQLEQGEDAPHVLPAWAAAMEDADLGKMGQEPWQERAFDGRGA